MKGKGTGMSFESKIRELLIENGMFDKQADAVILLAKENQINDAMKDRWNDSTEHYPPVIMNMLWFSTKKIALDYIEKNIPNAWLKPMFM